MSSTQCRRIPFNTGRWTDEEHEGFIRGLEAYGDGNWDAIGITFVPTRSPVQIQAHAWHHFSRGADPTVVQHTPGAVPSSASPSPAPSLSPVPPAQRGGGFNGDGNGDGNNDRGVDGDGDGHGFGDGGDGFGSDDDVLIGDGTGFGGDDRDDDDVDGGDDSGRYHGDLREAVPLGRAVPDHQQPGSRRMWSRAGRPMAGRVNHVNNASTDEMMLRSFSVYDPLGIL